MTAAKGIIRSRHASSRRKYVWSSDKSLYIARDAAELAAMLAVGEDPADFTILPDEVWVMRMMANGKERGASCREWARCRKPGRLLPP